MVSPHRSDRSQGGAEYLSIGDVATATGIAADTLRVWERRYGRPKPVRRPSGHRRYTDRHVRWLRRVSEALARGHRPGKVIGLSDAELTELLSEGKQDPAEEQETKHLLDLLRGFHGDQIFGRLRQHWRRSTAADFLSRHVAPLIKSVGRMWADGQLEVRHEHFLSELLEDLLRELRSGFPLQPFGPRIVLATMPEENHGLGLQMAALLCAEKGALYNILGTNTPIDQIVRAAVDTQANAVALSVSLATGGVETDRMLAALRKELPDGIRLVVGGEGARGVRRGPRGIEYVESLHDWGAWLGAFAEQHRQSA